MTLPKLPDESTPQAALRCGDGITEVEPLIGDVSGGAARWWTQLMNEVNAVYKVWLSSDALTRLEVDVQVKPNATRLEGRVTSMLLAALPSSIKSDIIANRKLTAASIMLEVMERFQPGGLGEKSGLLRALTAPETAVSPANGVEKLRLWSRNVARAMELGVTLPDPVLQIGALDSIRRQILNKEPQINFTSPEGQVDACIRQLKRDAMWLDRKIQDDHQELVRMMKAVGTKQPLRKQKYCRPTWWGRSRS